MSVRKPLKPIEKAVKPGERHPGNEAHTRFPQVHFEDRFAVAARNGRKDSSTGKVPS